MSFSRITEKFQIVELVKKILMIIKVPEEVGFGPIKYNTQAEIFTKLMDLTDNEIDEILKEIKEFNTGV